MISGAKVGTSICAALHPPCPASPPADVKCAPVYGDFCTNAPDSISAAYEKLTGHPRALPAYLCALALLLRSRSCGIVPLSLALRVRSSFLCSEPRSLSLSLVDFSLAVECQLYPTNTGETLADVSLIWDVDLDGLKAINPTLSDPLAAGTVVEIPGDCNTVRVLTFHCLLACFPIHPHCAQAKAEAQAAADPAVNGAAALGLSLPSAVVAVATLLW